MEVKVQRNSLHTTTESQEGSHCWQLRLLKSKLLDEEKDHKTWCIPAVHNKHPFFRFQRVPISLTNYMVTLWIKKTKNLKQDSFKGIMSECD